MKIVQIVVTPYNALYALTEDGRVFVYTYTDDDATQKTWEEVPRIPKELYENTN